MERFTGRVRQLFLPGHHWSMVSRTSHPWSTASRTSLEINHTVTEAVCCLAVSCRRADSAAGGLKGPKNQVRMKLECAPESAAYYEFRKSPIGWCQRWETGAWRVPRLDWIAKVASDFLDVTVTSAAAGEMTGQAGMFIGISRMQDYVLLRTLARQTSKANWSRAARQTVGHGDAHSSSRNVDWNESDAGLSAQRRNSASTTRSALHVRVPGEFVIAKPGPQQVEIRVVDDGVGLPPGWTLETSSGMGLSVTRERIVGLHPDGNSNFSVLPRTGGGTEVKISLPLRFAGEGANGPTQ